MLIHPARWGRSFARDPLEATRSVEDMATLLAAESVVRHETLPAPASPLSSTASAAKSSAAPDQRDEIQADRFGHLSRGQVTALPHAARSHQAAEAATKRAKEITEFERLKRKFLD